MREICDRVTLSALPPLGSAAPTATKWRLRRCGRKSASAFEPPTPAYPHSPLPHAVTSTLRTVRRELNQRLDEQKERFW